MAKKHYSYNTLKQLLKKKDYPVFYAEIDNQLILIYAPNYSRAINCSLSKKDKRLLNKKNENTLPPTEKLIAYDRISKVEIIDKKFRLLPARIDGGICISIYNNMTVETFESNYRNCFQQ